MKKKLISAVLSAALCISPICGINMFSTENINIAQAEESASEDYVLEQLNNVIGMAQLMQITIKYSDVLNLDYEYYDKLDGNSQSQLLSSLAAKITHTKYTSLDLFRRDFYNLSYQRYVLIERQQRELINTSDASRIKTLIEQYYMLFGLDMEYYDRFTDEEKLSVCESLCGRGFSNADEVADCFNKSVLLTRINNIDNPDDLRHLIDENNSLLDLDYTYYDMLDSSFQDDILNEIIALNNTYSEIEDFRNEFYLRSEEKYTSLKADEQSHLLEEIRHSADPQEIQSIIEDKYEIIGLDMTYYDSFAPDAKSFVCEYLYREKDLFDNFSNVCNCFLEAVLLSRINNASWGELQVIIEENRDIIIINWSDYDKMTDKNKAKIFKALSDREYDDFRHFCVEFDQICDSISSENSSSGGSSIGGGGGGYFRTYTLTPDGQTFDGEPQIGTPVKLVVKALYLGEPSVSYIAAVYDTEDRLSSVAIHKSEATVLYESEFFELNTTYNPNFVIKLLRIENSTGFKPLDDTEGSFFDYTSEIPEKETEQEGITAVKGNICEETAEYFTLDLTDMRACGYWGAPLPEERTIKIKFSGAELEAYRSLSFNEIAYNIAPNEDGTYSLCSVDTKGELIRFTGADVAEVTADTLTLNIDGAEIVLTSGEYTDFEYIDFSGEHYFAYLIDNKVDFIISYSYSASQVLAISGGKVVFTDSLSIDTNMADSELKAGDIAVFRGDIACKAEKANAIYYDGYVTINDKQYTTDFAEQTDVFVDGEACIAYLDPEERLVQYIEKDYESSELILVSSINLEADGVTLVTNKGEKKLSGKVCYGNTLITANELSDILQDRLPYVMYISYGNEMVNLETPTELYNGIGTYSSATQSIGGYPITNGRIATVTNEKVYEVAKLANRQPYNITVWSFDGRSADYIFIIDNEGNSLNTTSYMIVSDWSDDYVTGFVDGVEKTINYQIDFNIYKGCILKITSRFGDILSVSTTIPDGIINTRMEYADNLVMYLPVFDILNSCIYMQQNSQRCAVAVLEDTQIYLVDTEEDTIKKAALSDIYYNPFSTDDTDWVLVKKTSAVTDMADYIIIYK